MEKENNENTSNGKAKDVSSTSNSHNNIQPRVVLQRLSKDYTIGVASGSDNQPSTSGCLSPNNKSPEVDSSVSDDTSDSTINTGANNLATPSTSKPTTSGNYFRRNEAVDFRVAPLKEIDLSEIQPVGSAPSDEDTTSSDCSYHSSPREVVLVDESRTGTEEGDDDEESDGIEEADEIEAIGGIGAGEEVEEGEESEQVDDLAEGSELDYLGIEDGGEVEEIECEECVETDPDRYDKPTSPDSLDSDVNWRRITRHETKIRKAIAFLKLLIDSYGRQSASVDSTYEADEHSNPGPSEGRYPAGVPIPVTGTIEIKPQRNNVKDCVVRVWLSIRGQKKKRKFHVKLSQLILLLNNKDHPLHNFRNSLNLRTLGFLSENELRVMAKVLSDFVCAKRVRI